MKTFYTILFTILFSANFLSQTVVLNEKLLAQLTKNQTVRLASNKQFLNSYEKQRELYDKVNQKLLQVQTIQQYIFDNLSNVNEAISQGKKLMYLYKYLGEIQKNAGAMLKETAAQPQYAILLYAYYENIIKEATNLYQEIPEMLRQDKDFLMDSFERDAIINTALGRARGINANVLFILLKLQMSKDLPYLEQIPKLNTYILMDKVIIKDIIEKYKYIKL